nr:Unknown Function [uncultured bacterium]
MFLSMAIRAIIFLFESGTCRILKDGLRHVPNMTKDRRL